MRSLRFAVTGLFAATTLAAIVQCSGSTAAVTGGVSCTALTSCCANGALSVSNQTACATIATAESEESCEAVLALYCGAETISGRDSGTGTGPGFGSGTGEIDATVANPACAELTACCGSSSLTGDELTACYDDANAGVASTCATVLASYTGAGVCAGGGTGPGSGPGTGIDSGIVVGGFDAGIDGNAGQVCASFCTVDTDCSSTCPAVVDRTYCCDAVASVCYETTNLTCPVTSTDAGVDSSMY